MDYKILLNAAYATVLGREPDPAGFENYLTRLMAGENFRLIFRELYSSEEAQGRRASSAHHYIDVQETFTSLLSAYSSSSANNISLGENESKLAEECNLLKLKDLDFNEYYKRLITDSNLFDHDFYLLNYEVPQEYKHDPIFHFVLIGEMEGLKPNERFCPISYLKYNTDVALSGIRPFLHYLESGRYEERICLPLAPSAGSLSSTSLPNLRGRAFANPKEIAICVHLYYEELWPELRSAMLRLKASFDLFVGIVCRGNDTGQIQHEILRDFPSAKIFVFPNHGRDIFPFVYMATAGLFESYKAVCKIHTKKSPHRVDGDHWRSHLIDGILPCGGSELPDSDELIRLFLNDPGKGVLVADGQIFEGEKWWGSNKRRVSELLRRIEIEADPDRLRFPAGSIYWIKEPVINLLRGMQLSAHDFEVENSQIDGTTAHALERTIGYLSEALSLTVVQTTELRGASQWQPLKTVKPFVSCFYLPQFHRTKENDTWWGHGYTEWTAAANACPQFAGHKQPVLPLDFGFYDLRVPEVIGEQYSLARRHGVDAFCIYYYCFDNGQRLLEQPVDNLLGRPDIDVSFYLCWANESWTRNWDGLSGEILMPQTYLPGFEKSLAHDTAKYFRDPRYLKRGGGPRFVIYRPDDIPNVDVVISRLRLFWAELGFEQVNLGAVLFHLNEGMAESLNNLFDFFVEMPPHGLVGAADFLDLNELNAGASPVVPAFTGLIYSYDAVVKNSLLRTFASDVATKVVRGVMPSWDNTARRGSGAHICYGSNPGSFKKWVKSLKNDYGCEELMINSWNEWGEKAMIEPSIQYGKGYLRALKAGLELD